MKTMYELPEVRIRLCEGASLYSTEPVLSPDIANKLIRTEMKYLDREALVVLNLDSQLHPINFNVVSIGCDNKSAFKMGDVFKSSILSSASCIMLFHNHPSGNPSPSEEDINITRRIINAGSLLDINLMDHIIVGGDTYYSFLKSMSYLFEVKES